MENDTFEEWYVNKEDEIKERFIEDHEESFGGYVDKIYKNETGDMK